MIDSELGGTKETWAFKGERKNGKLNMDVPALVDDMENQGDTSGHF